MKTCTKCQIEKPLSEFHKRALSPDGLRPMCKICVKAYQAKWRQDPAVVKHQAAYDRQRGQKPERRERHRTYNATYHQRFQANPAKAEARRDWRRDYENKQYQSSPDFRHRKIVRAHRMRAKPCKDGYTQLEWETLCARYNHYCLCCKERKPLTADHVIPLSRGGSNTIENLQPLCLSCNDRKYTNSTDYRLTWEPI